MRCATFSAARVRPNAKDADTVWRNAFTPTPVPGRFDNGSAVPDPNAMTTVSTLTGLIRPAEPMRDGSSRIQRSRFVRRQS
jgi:hypothetical protein